MSEDFNFGYYKEKIEKIDNEKRVLFDRATRDVCTIIMKEIIHDYPIIDRNTPSCVKTAWELINELDVIMGITR